MNKVQASKQDAVTNECREGGMGSGQESRKVFWKASVRQRLYDLDSVARRAVLPD